MLDSTGFDRQTAIQYTKTAIRDTKTAIVGDDDEVDRTGTALLGAMAGSLTLAILLFLFRPGLVVFPVVAFLALAIVGWFTYQAQTARLLTLVATASTVLTLGFITIFLFLRAFPALRHRGFHLLIPPGAKWVVTDGTTLFVIPVKVQLIMPTVWNPSAGVYSLLPTIWATIVVTVISASIAGPLGILGALFISEIAPDTVRSFVKPAVEILAGIPSIVYGFIGFMVLNDYVRVQFLDTTYGSFLIAGIVVGVMALPTVVSVAEDALSSVPDSMSDGALAMGATRWQTMKSISIPAAFSGISAAVILGLGRAIGETMAVAAIMAGGVGLPKPLYDVFGQSATLTSLIATQYGSATESTLEVLFVAGVILFLIVAGMSVVSQRIQQRMEQKLTGEQ